MTSRILAIDPGHAGRGCACALYADLQLHDVWFGRIETRPAVRQDVQSLLAPNHPRRQHSAITAIVVEKPVPQGGRTLSARYEDLINLAWSGALLAGDYAGASGAAIYAWPATDWGGVRGWKGGEAKPHNHRRLWALLDDDERAALGGEATWREIDAACEKWALKRGGIEGAKCYKTDMHNLLDAAALGACFVGRMKRV